MDGKGRTLGIMVDVDDIKNLTNKSIWVYGTSGEVVEFPPSGIDVKAMDLSDLKYSIYYIVNKKIKDILLDMDPQFGDHIIKATQIGKGREGETLYHITQSEGRPVLPITERIGSPGGKLFVSNF